MREKCGSAASERMINQKEQKSKSEWALGNTSLNSGEGWVGTIE